MTWTSTRQARELLASCVDSPPARDQRTGSFNQPTPMFRLSDPRVKQLVRFWKLAFDEAFDRGDMDAAKAIFALNPDKAIRNAINNSTRRAA